MPDLADLAQFWGEDLNLSVTGDLAVSTGTDRSQQRVLRRLMTNPGEYLFSTGYGGGIRQLIGKAAEPARVRSLIRSELLAEPAVAASPEPTITVQPIADGLSAQAQFTDAVTRNPAALAFIVDSQ